MYLHFTTFSYKVVPSQVKWNLISAVKTFLYKFEGNTDEEIYKR